MNEKVKKILLSLLLRSTVALFLFLTVVVIRRFSPELFLKISFVWEKSIDIEKTGSLLKELLKEVFI